MNKSEIILNYYNHLEKLSDDISNINIQLQSISLLLKKNQHFLEKQKYLKNKKIILLKGGDRFDKLENMNVDCDNVKKLFDTFSHELQMKNPINISFHMAEFKSNYEKFKNIFSKHKSDYENYEAALQFEDLTDSYVFSELNQILNNLFYIIFDLIHYINSSLKDVNEENDAKDQFITFSYEIFKIYKNFTKKINEYITDSIRTIKGIESETDYSDRIKSKIYYSDRIMKTDRIESKINYSDIKSILESTNIPDVGSIIFKKATYISPNNKMQGFSTYETKETYLVIYPNYPEYYGREINVHRYITYICNTLDAKRIDIKSSFILLKKSNEIPFEYGYTDSSYNPTGSNSLDRKFIFFQYQKYDANYNLIEVLEMLLDKIKNDITINLHDNIIPLISLIFELFYTFYLLNHILRIIVNCRFEDILVEKLISPKICKYYIYDKIYTFYKFYNVRISNFTQSEFIIDKVGLLTSKITYYMITYKIIMQIILLLIHTLDEDQSGNKSYQSIMDKFTYSHNKKIIKNLIDLILKIDPNVFQLITNYIEENPHTYNTSLNVNSYLPVNGYLANRKITMIYLLQKLLENSFIQTVLLNRYLDLNFINQDYSYRFSNPSHKKYLKYKNKYLNKKYVNNK